MDNKLKNWCKKQRSLYANRCISQDKIYKLEAIEGWLWDVFTGVWDINYNNLLEYVNTHNCIPTSTNSKLGVWCNTQRTNYISNQLSQNRIDKLESISCWYWNWNDYTWNNKFNILFEYVNIQNNQLPYNSCPIHGNFISVQRIRYTSKLMPEEQIKLMETLNGWHWGKMDIWDKKYKILHKCVNIDKNPIPPQTNKQIGVWVSDQRSSYKQNILSEYQIKLLESIDGWYWDFRELVDIKWFNTANNLKLVDIPSLKLNDPKFGSWINNTRNDYRDGTLSQDKIDFLNSVDGWVWYVDFDKKWEDVAYNLTYENHFNDKNYSAWCARQRCRYKKGILEPKRIDILNSFDWWYWENPTDHIWNTMYDTIRNYTENDTHNKFRNWIAVQRTKYKKHTLTETQINKLESIEWWQWKELEENWENNIKGLKEYIDTHKIVPKYDEPYGGWVKRQRYNYHKGKMSKKRIKALESITGWSWGKNNT